MVARSALPLTLSALAALLALGLSLAGLARPELYQPMTPARLMPGTLSQDIVSLAAALGLLAVSRPLSRRSAARLWLVWLGLLGYLAYAYGLYAFETVVNPLYLGYIAVFGLALWAVFVFFARADRGRVRPFGPPRRLTAALFALLAALFLILWLSILIPAMASRTPPEGATIFVFDLAFALPALLACAVLLWRGAAWGDLLALPLLVKLATLGLSVLVGTLIGPLWGFAVVPAEVATYAVLALLPAALLPTWWRALAPQGHPPGAGAAP